MLDKAGTQSYSLQIQPTGNRIACRSNQTLLDACIQTGIPVSYNCRSGECGECIAMQLSGQTQEMPGADPAVFDDAKRAAGRILLCMCFPRSDVSLDVPIHSDRPAIRPEIINAMVQSIERVTPTIVHVSVETPGPVEYRAGQCFEWILPGIIPNRMYSAANRPGSDRIDFHVRVYPGGKVGEFLTDHLSAGQTMQIMGPFGHFAFSENDWRPSICVAGGTGLAPIHAVLDQAFAQGDQRPIQFYYGARNQDELYCLDQLERWSAEHRSFQFTPVLSDEPENSGWSGERGLVTDILARRIGDPFGPEAYVCGPPAMIDAAIAIFTGAGLTPEDIRADRFVQVK